MSALNKNRILPTNSLPKDGLVFYYGKIMPESLADYYFSRLLQGIEWKNDEAILFGKKHVTKRKAAWYGDAPFAYTYSRVTKIALPWTQDLLVIKALAESVTGQQYNACLLNLYHDGLEGMAWHSDDEKDLAKNGSIASLSLGAARPFGFKHKKEPIKVMLQLEHGSLLEMTGATQTHWLHRLPPSKRVLEPRINLTFRQMAQSSQ